MRRLGLLLSAMIVAETLLYSALSPLLPAFEKDLGFSKSQSGLLVAMFPVGMGVAALPVALLVSHIGVKRFALAGLVGLGLASVGFGLVDGYVPLVGTRLVQGVAAGLCWSAAFAWMVGATLRERRAEMIGLLAGAGAAGQVLGPMIGGAAVLTSRSVVFIAVGAVSFLIAVAVARFPEPGRGAREALRVDRRTPVSRVALRSQWLVALPGLLLGTILVLAPLQMDRNGWGPIGVSVTFLIAAFVGAVSRPLIGRWADGTGLLTVIRLLLVATVPATLAIPWVSNRWLLSACVIWAVTTCGAIWGPGLARVSHACEAAGIAQVLGFALVAVTIGISFFIGSAGGGELAHLGGDAAAYSVGAGVFLATYLALLQRRRPSVEPTAQAGVT